jgi:hypothetical protein
MNYFLELKERIKKEKNQPRPMDQFQPVGRPLVGRVACLGHGLAQRSLGRLSPGFMPSAAPRPPNGGGGKGEPFLGSWPWKLTGKG